MTQREPERLRHLLHTNPSLTYALLHAQATMGMIRLDNPKLYATPSQAQFEPGPPPPPHGAYSAQPPPPPSSSSPPPPAMSAHVFFVICVLLMVYCSRAAARTNAPACGKHVAARH